MTSYEYVSIKNKISSEFEQINFIVPYKQVPKLLCTSHSISLSLSNKAISNRNSKSKRNHRTDRFLETFDRRFAIIKPRAQTRSRESVVRMKTRVRSYQNRELSRIRWNRVSGSVSRWVVAYLHITSFDRSASSSRSLFLLFNFLCPHVTPSPASFFVFLPRPPPILFALLHTAHVIHVRMNIESLDSRLRVRLPMSIPYAHAYV